MTSPWPKLCSDLNPTCPTTTHLSKFQPFEPHPLITYLSHNSEENSHPYILNPLIGDSMQHFKPLQSISYFSMIITNLCILWKSVQIFQTPPPYNPIMLIPILPAKPSSLKVNPTRILILLEPPQLSQSQDRWLDHLTLPLVRIQTPIHLQGCLNPP